MPQPKLTGLIAAVVTPFTPDGAVDLAGIPLLTEFLIHNRIDGFYVCGSTGEGMSLTTSERKSVLEAYVRAVDGRIPVIAQVGHNSLVEAQLLAAHAAESGADIVSATCPSYFKVNDTRGLTECMSAIASAAPTKPFYYYHIPALTGSQVDVIDFLRNGRDPIPNLAGLKYTDTRLFEFHECVELGDGAFDVVWGCDEMLLGALATGAQAAIGSTYNVAAPLYRRIISAFQSGDLESARSQQLLAVHLVREMVRYPFHGALREILAMCGQETGGCRPPLSSLAPDQVPLFREAILSLGLQEWGCVPT